MKKKYIPPKYFFDGKYWMAYTPQNTKVGCATSKTRAHEIYCKNNGMAIKSTTFGRTELSGNDAARFIQHMKEDKPNEKLRLALQKGDKILASIARNTRLYGK